MNLVAWDALDLFFIILGCYFIIRGYLRGFIGELITLVGYAAAVYLSFRFSGLLGEMISGVAGLAPSVGQVLAIVIIWLAVVLLASIPRNWARRALTATSLGGFDRLLGIFSGIFKIVLTVYLVFVGGLLLEPIANPSWMNGSFAMRLAGQAWPSVRRILEDFSVLPEGRKFPGNTLDEFLRRTPTNAEPYEPTVPKEIEEQRI